MQTTMSALNVPTVVWSGIVAALISLEGIVLSNWSTARRLRIQLKHDADEKLKDRLGVLRKEVYLQLYSDITALQGHLGALSSKDPTSPEFGLPVQAVNTQLAKVQLAGSEEVMRHASELQALYTESPQNRYMNLEQTLLLQISSTTSIYKRRSELQRKSRASMSLVVQTQ